MSLCFAFSSCSDEQLTNGELVAQELQEVFKTNNIDQVVCVKNDVETHFEMNIPISIKGTFLYIGKQQAYAYNLEQLTYYHIIDKNGSSHITVLYLHFH